MRIPYVKSRRRSVSVSPEQLENLPSMTNTDIPSSYKESKINFDKELSKTCFDSTISWVLLRHINVKMIDLNVQAVPAWKGFRKIVSAKVSFPTTTGNCRTIPQPPTDMNVVYTAMLNIQKMLTNLGQQDVCITIDESIYEIAKKLQWTVDSLKSVTLRLGGFHRAKNFLGVIGKRMKSVWF